MMASQVRFEVSLTDDSARFTKEQGVDLESKEMDISRILINFNMKGPFPYIHLMMYRYHCLGGKSWEPVSECYGEYKTIRDNFMMNHPDYRHYEDHAKIHVDSDRPPLSLKEAKNVIKAFLDAVFASLELNQDDQSVFIKYCKKRGFKYSFPPQSVEVSYFDEANMKTQKSSLSHFGLFSKVKSLLVALKPKGKDTKMIRM